MFDRSNTVDADDLRLSAGRLDGYLRRGDEMLAQSVD
jgi:hypothetical protein